MTRPCRGNFTGRAITASCDNCGHTLAAHDNDYVCGLCAAIRQMQADVQAGLDEALALFDAQVDERLTQIYQAIKLLEEVLDGKTS